MTQPATAVDGAPASPDARTDAIDTFDAIAREMLGEEEDQQPAEDADGEPDATEGAEGEPDGEAQDDDLPPITAPNSLTPEEKAQFDALPREAQEFTARRIGELERGFNQKAQEAAFAKRESERLATQQLARIEAQYAAQYQAIADQFVMPEPDLSLLATDPMAYAGQMQQYKQFTAQRQQAQQTAQYYASQAQQREAQATHAYHAEQQRILIEQFPEYADPTTGPKVQQDLTAVARALGYPPELIGEATAQDILAVRQAAEWKAKADRFDKLNASKMEKVRAAKGLPPVSRPGVPVGNEQLRNQQAAAAFDRARNATSFGDKADAFGEWARTQGII